MDLQRRISHLLAISGTALLVSGVVAGALIGDAGAASQPQPEPGHQAHETTTTSDATTSTTRKPKSSTTTTAAPTTTTEARPTTTTRPAASASAPSTTTTMAPTTTTTASSASAGGPGQGAPDQGDQGQGAQGRGGQGQAPDQGASQNQGQATNQGASAAQVGPTTSTTLNDTVSRAPKSPVVPPGQPPAAPVTSSTVSNPVPPAPVANPLPRTPVTAFSGPPPNPVTLEAVQETPPVGPPLPPWDTQATTPGSESPRQPAGAAAGTPTRRRASQLGMTGSSTRTLLFLAGVALLLGAVAVALGEPGPLRTAHTTAAAKTPKARTRKLRRTIPGWESGVPLAPTRRAAKRARLERRGSLQISFPGDGPGA